MASHVEFYQWLVIDWEKAREAWEQADEEADGYLFLLVTPNERRWVANASLMSLPADGFVLVIFVDINHALSAQDFDVDNILKPNEGGLPIWCHYGGRISLPQLEDRWQWLSVFEESVRDRLTKLMPGPCAYPMPISESHPYDLDWQNEWADVRAIIDSYDGSKWDELKAKLNEAWEKAIGQLRISAAEATRTAWANAAQACERLRDLLPKAETAPTEGLSRILQEARALEISQLEPLGNQGRLGNDVLSTTFKAVLDAVENLSDGPGHTNTDLMKNHIDLLRYSLLAFRKAYDEVA